MGKNKILIVNHHGIGDNIMMTPSVRALKKSQPETEIYLLVTGEYGAIKDLWSTNVYVTKVFASKFTFHPQFWNPVIFYLKDYPLIKKEAQELAREIKADKIFIIHQQYLPEFIEKKIPFLPGHRIDRIAYELKVKLEDFNYDVFPQEQHEKEALSFLKRHNLENTDLIALHTMPSNAGPRTWWLKEVKPFTEELHKRFGFKFILFHDRKSYQLQQTLETESLDEGYVFSSYRNGEKEMGILSTAALLKKCKAAVTIDSAVAYLASAVNVPLVLLCHIKNTLDERKPRVGVVEGLNAESFTSGKVTDLLMNVFKKSGYFSQDGQ